MAGGVKTHSKAPPAAKLKKEAGPVGETEKQQEKQEEPLETGPGRGERDNEKRTGRLEVTWQFSSKRLLGVSLLLSCEL